MTSGPSAADVRAAQSELILPGVVPYYEEPLVLVEGAGSRVRDAEGREYLDAFAGILTTSLGHCHPRVVEAIRSQAGRLGHTSTLYLNEPMVEAARRLAAIAPGELRRTFFSNSGTEAVETALGLARAYTGRTEIVALRGAYHGRSALAATVTGQGSWRPLPSTQAGVAHARAPYPYRCPFGEQEGATRRDRGERPAPDHVCGERCAEAFAADLEETILTATNGRPAAFIAETIQGVNGYVVPPPGYFRRAAEVIRRYGGLLVVDEVQAGFGRTGGRWFGIEHQGVVPDIMVLAKGIAGGMPVGATITTDEIAGGWHGKTISTFGGNPIAMAAMSATLDVMVEEDVPALAERRGARLRAGLEALASCHPWIGDVRGMGLMQALELVEDREGRAASPRRARALLESARAEGLLIGTGGLHGQVIRLGPSLLFTEAEVDETLARLGRACARVE